MKFYVAAGFEEKERVREIYEMLKNRGHSITCNWTFHKSIQPYTDNLDLARDYTTEDIAGVCHADIFILLTKGAGKGAHVELGAAIAMHATSGKPKIYVVGEEKDKQMFYFHPLVSQKKSIEDVLAEL